MTMSNNISTIKRAMPALPRPLSLPLSRSLSLTRLSPSPSSFIASRSIHMQGITQPQLPQRKGINILLLSTNFQHRGLHTHTRRLQRHHAAAASPSPLNQHSRTSRSSLLSPLSIHSLGLTSSLFSRHYSPNHPPPPPADSDPISIQYGPGTEFAPPSRHGLPAPRSFCLNPHYRTEYLELESLVENKWHKNFLIFLVALNLVIYQFWPKDGARERTAYDHFTTSYRNLKEGRWWTLVTHAFAHGSIPHLLFNMICLWGLAPAVMGVAGGPLPFMALYIGAASVGAGAHMFYCNYIVPKVLKKKPHIIKRRRHDGRLELVHTYDTPALGASGSISAMIVIFAALWPKAKFQLMFLPLPIQARFFVPGFIAFDFITSLAPSDKTFIAHWGHLGGALFGALYYFGFIRGRYRPTGLTHPPVDPNGLYAKFRSMAQAEQQAASATGAATSTMSAAARPSGGVTRAFTPRRPGPKQTSKRPFTTLATSTAMHTNRLTKRPY